MHKIVSCLVLSFVLLSVPGASAQEWFADVSAGYSSVDFDIESAADAGQDLVSDDAGFSGTIGAGYYFSESVYAKLSYAGYSSLTPAILLGQSVDYSSVRAGVGFEFPTEGRWAFSVEAGAAFWDAEATESFLFNPGPEESASVDGTDLYFRLGGAFRISDKVDIGLYGDFENNDIGDTAGVQLGVRFKF